MHMRVTIEQVLARLALSRRKALFSEPERVLGVEEINLALFDIDVRPREYDDSVQCLRSSEHYWLVWFVAV